MRLKLSLSAINSITISSNYYYPLSCAIYKLLRFGSLEFSHYLHDIGFKTAGKTYKLFSFALKFNHSAYNKGVVELLSPRADLYITSPLIDDFIKNFVVGTFEEQKIEIVDSNIKTQFIIKQMELLPQPTFTEKCKFSLMTPIVLSTASDVVNGKLRQYYLRYYDSIDETNRILTQNLINKYNMIYNEQIQSSNLKLEWDKNYIDRRLAKHQYVVKKITIKADDNIPIDIIGNQIPFEITGNTELIKVGYECGFGEKNSMGFGMVDYVK